MTPKFTKVSKDKELFKNSNEDRKLLSTRIPQGSTPDSF